MDDRTKLHELANRVKEYIQYTCGPNVGIAAETLKNMGVTDILAGTDQKCLICGSELLSFYLGYGSEHDGRGVCWACASDIIDPAINQALSQRKNGNGGK